MSDISEAIRYARSLAQIIAFMNPPVVLASCKRPMQIYLLVTDVLEQRTDILLLGFLTKQMILDPAHRPILAVVDEMVPGARITVQHGLRFDELPAILAAFALERVVRVAARLGVVKEELAQAVG